MPACPGNTLFICACLLQKGLLPSAVHQCPFPRKTLVWVTGLLLPMDVSAGVSPLFAAKVPSPPVGTPGQGGGGGDCAQPNADFSVRSTMPNCLLS